MSETRPQAVRVRSSGDPDRPIALAYHPDSEPALESVWEHVYFTRSQARTVLLAFTAELARTMPGPVIQRQASQGSAVTASCLTNTPPPAVTRSPGAPTTPPPPAEQGCPFPVPQIPTTSRRFDARDPRSIGQARRFVRHQCDAWSLDGDVRDSAAVIVSELGTNSLTHSGSPEFEVTLSLVSTEHGTVLCIEVGDQGRWLSGTPSVPDQFAECGRGTAVVCGYAVASGVVHDPETGTRAWAHVAAGFAAG